MKKVVIIILIAFSIFNINAQSVLDFTGFDWNEWTETYKAFYVTGFMAGCISTSESYKYMLETNDAELNDYQTWALEHLCNYDIFSVGDIIILLDGYYYPYKNREITIPIAIMLVTEK